MSSSLNRTYILTGCREYLYISVCIWLVLGTETRYQYGTGTHVTGMY